MDYKFVLSAILALGILSTVCHAQTTGNFQSVGEDFGRKWLKNSQAENSTKQTQAQNSTSLWSWGGAPKGRMIQNGSLVADPYYIWKSLNLTSGWMGQAYVDPKTGHPVYAFTDPYTGNPDYFYVDPKTGNPVYINSDASSGTPSYSSVPPYYPYSGSTASSDYPWLGTTYGSTPYVGDYGGVGMA